MPFVVFSSFCRSALSRTIFCRCSNAVWMKPGPQALLFRSVRTMLTSGHHFTTCPVVDTGDVMKNGCPLLLEPGCASSTGAFTIPQVVCNHFRPLIQLLIVSCQLFFPHILDNVPQVIFILHLFVILSQELLHRRVAVSGNNRALHTILCELGQTPLQTLNLQPVAALDFCDLDSLLCHHQT